MRAHKVAGRGYLCEMKVGIVVPYSWSFWGAVVEHAELQAAALRNLGHDVRLVMGNDPPGSFTRVLHPRLGRHGEPPPEVIPIGRSVIVPANGSLPNIILSPRSILRIRRVLEAERFDLLHLHEPMTPTPCVAALALASCPLVATFHASGELSWLKLAKPAWGFLLDRLDHRIAVSEQARESASRYFPGDYELIPNGVLVPEAAEAGSREEHIVFVGRHEPRKGLQVLLRAWPEIRRRSGARLRVVGADPLAVRLLFARLRVPDEGVDVLGFLSQDELTAELLRAKALVAPSLGGESFGMVLTRAFACATPVVASDISGYRGVMEPRAGRLVPPGRSAGPGRRGRQPARGRARARRAGSRGSDARTGALLMGGDRATAVGDLPGNRRVAEGVRGIGMSKLLKAKWARAALVLLAFAGMIAFFIWHGPKWGLVLDAFRFVAWEWVVAAIALNLLSVVARAAAWNQVIEQAVPPPQPPFRAVFSAFGVGLFANAVLPGRIGELARVAVLSRRIEEERRADTWAVLLGTVFAHRVLDLFPVVLLIGYVAATAKIPHWAVASLIVFLIVAFALFGFALASARHRNRTVLEDAEGGVRRLITMARYGLGVLHAPVPAVSAALLQCLGWLCQLFAVWASMRAFDIHEPLPAAGLVLLLMNVAMLFPLWPGNVGLVQAAVALPLVSYGVPYAKGFAFGIGLQAIEMSVGVGIGFLFLAREGLSYAMLKHMPGAEQAEVSEPDWGGRGAGRGRAA